MMKLDTAKYLIQIGLKDKLISMLSEEQLHDLAEYAIENANISHDTLVKDLTSMASLEMRGKIGVTKLIKYKIITAGQARGLSADQIETILDILENFDVDLEKSVREAVKTAHSMILNNQQISLAHHKEDYKAYLSDEEEISDLTSRYRF